MQNRNIHPAENYDPRDDMLKGLADTIQSLVEENTLLKDKISIGQWNASEIEKIDIVQTLEELREANRILEIDNRTLKDDRNWYQNRAAETMGSRNYWEKQAKRLQKIIDQGGQNV
ncbi:hypothetical protein ICN30_07215 [Polynucleobacter sp. 31A-FELB]|uniref:hypothetical protein n=1 Tax=Polynucleobacter sp. 31A-FELB TaxID=2689096 RepID=UPI001C0DCF32|nr:hypothetical protein [Polynucleobacter sp. 31A-FELB]MBU3587620.1 hypothetical protein [Polynucleobacter sp. 31A-FELB]